MRFLESKILSYKPSQVSQMHQVLLKMENNSKKFGNGKEFWVTNATY